MSNTEEFEKNGMTDTLVLLQTKPNQVGETYVVAGTLVHDGEAEITIRRPVSPTIQGSTTLLFHQHMIPSVLLAPESLDNVLTVVRKEYLTFYTLFRLDDPHPLCEEYQRFWAPAEEIQDPVAN